MQSRGSGGVTGIWYLNDIQTVLSLYDYDRPYHFLIRSVTKNNMVLEYKHEPKELNGIYRLYKNILYLDSLDYTQKITNTFKTK